MHGAFFLELHTRDVMPVEEEISASCFPKISYPNDDAFSLVYLVSIVFTVGNYNYLLSFGIKGTGNFHSIINAGNVRLHYCCLDSLMHSLAGMLHISGSPRAR